MLGLCTGEGGGNCLYLISGGSGGRGVLVGLKILGYFFTIHSSVLQCTSLLHVLTNGACFCVCIIVLFGVFMWGFVRIYQPQGQVTGVY